MLRRHLLQSALLLPLGALAQSQKDTVSASTEPREGTWDRPLFHLGEHTFHPAGTPSVRIKFVNDPGGTLMTVTDADTVLTARKRAEKK